MRIFTPVTLILLLLLLLLLVLLPSPYMTEPGLQPIQQKPNKPAERMLHHGIEFFPAVLAGFIAVFISYAGPMLLIVKAAQAAHLTPEQMASWIWAISIGAGLIGAFLSWKHKMPIIFAWSTPGAALLVTALVTLPYPQAIAAYFFSALLMYLIGVTGIFERLMLLIPKSLCGAMLAGILLRFAIDIFAAAQNSSNGSSILVGILFIAYLVFKRLSNRYAIVLCLITGIFLWQCFDLGVLTTLNFASSSANSLQTAQALPLLNIETSLHSLQSQQRLN